MDFEARFYSIWSGVTDLEIPQPPVKEEMCPFAYGFNAWVEKMLMILDEPSLAKINQAKILLLDKYFEYYRSVPLSHRQRLGPNGHTCIFQVFLSCYERLYIAGLTLVPPILFDVEHFPKPIPPAHQIGGIFFGEQME